jgi:replication factor A1
MYDFEALIAELLKARPELSREELTKRIAQKKETVGAGYLTDQGALFLVAGELGVALQKASATSDLSIKDLYIGANEVTVSGRVLAIYPVSTYKKKDGGEGRYRRLVLFDGPHTVRLTIWDERADDVEKLGVGIDSPVRIVSGYVKQGLDGKPNLSLGKGGSMALLPEREADRLPRLSATTGKLAKVDQEKAFVALELLVDSEPRFSEFVRSDGTPGSLYQFGASGEQGSYRTRVVIWSPSDRPALRTGQKVVVTNVRSRRSSNGDFEIHGDAGSVVLAGRKPEPIRLRVAAISSSSSGVTFLGVDSAKKVRVVEVRDSSPAVEKGEVVKVSPDEMTGGRIVCRTLAAVEMEKGEGFPGLAELSTKLRDARDESSHVMVEVIALSHGTVEDVRLKDGSAVKKGELVVGDDTAELRVVGWRDQSSKISGIQPGERLRISGVTPKVMKMGGWELQLGPYTAIEKLRGRD